MGCGRVEVESDSINSSINTKGDTFNEGRLVRGGKAAALFNSAAVFFSTPSTCCVRRWGSSTCNCCTCCCSVLVLLVNCVLYALNARSYVLLYILRMLQITVKHIFNILRCCAATNTCVVLQAYNVIKKLHKRCYVLFVVYGFCIFTVVRHVVTLPFLLIVISILQFFQNCKCFMQHSCAMYAAQLQ